MMSHFLRLFWTLLLLIIMLFSIHLIWCITGTSSLSSPNPIDSDIIYGRPQKKTITSISCCANFAVKFSQNDCIINVSSRTLSSTPTLSILLLNRINFNRMKPLVTGNFIPATTDATGSDEWCRLKGAFRAGTQYSPMEEEVIIYINFWDK